MSKSLGNYIGIGESPNEIFGKTMSIPDDLMLKYFELSTSVTNEALFKLQEGLKDGDVHPRDAKIQLAKQFVWMYHGEEEAEQAEQHFISVFQKRSLPEHIEEFHVKKELLEDGWISISKLLVTLGFASSNNEARRSVAQRAVKINETKLLGPNDSVEIRSGDIIQAGKRKFAKIVVD